MLRSGLFLLFLTACFAHSNAAEQVINLWPDKVPGEDTYNKDFQKKVADAEEKNTESRVLGVTSPTLTIFPAPAERANGAAVVICPGGGYNVLAWDHEGLQIARWMNSIGVHAFLLKYRVPRRPDDYFTPPLQDAQRALRLTRQMAGSMQFDTGRIGILGFSAGGNLAVNAGTRFDETTYPTVDAADKLSCRPDFVIPIYAAYLGSGDDDQKLNPSLRINMNTPPMFMAVTQDDKNRGIHAALLFAELTRAGVKSEVHVHTRGGHGYGMRPSHNAVSEWPARCADWMRSMGLLIPTAQ